MLRRVARAGLTPDEPAVPPGAPALEASSPPPLKNGQFRYLVAALTVSGSGDWLYNAALIAFVLGRTNSAAWIAAASIARLAPQIVLGPIGGTIADRYDRKRVLLVSDLTRAALMGALAAVAATEGPVLFVLLIAGATTAAGTPYYPAIAALTPPIVGESHLASANAITKACEHLCIALGPALGGVLLGFGSPALAFAVNAFSFLGSAILTRRLKLGPEHALQQREVGLKEGLLQGVRAVTASRDMIVLVVLFAAVTFTLGQGFVLLPLVAERMLDTGPQGVGFLLTAIGVGGIIAAAPAGRLARSEHTAWFVVAAVFATGVPLVVLSQTTSAPVAYLLMGVEGAGAVILSVLAVTALQRLLSGDLIGRVFALLHSLAVASIVLGTLVAPVVVEWLSLKAALLGSGALLMGMAIVTYPKLHSLDARIAGRSVELEPRVAMLDALGIFDGASRAALEAMAGELAEMRTEPGELVVAQGEPARDFYVVRSGRLDVLWAPAGSDSAVKINELAPGDYFGEIGLIEGVPRTATVRATEMCELYRLHGDVFLETVSHSPAEPLVEAMLGRLALTHS